MSTDRSELHAHAEACLKCGSESTTGDPTDDNEVVCTDCGYGVKHHEKYNEIRYAYVG